MCVSSISPEARLFGLHLRLRRQTLGLTLRHLAAHLNLPPRLLANLERGRGVDTLDVTIAQRLAQWCGLCLDEMLGLPTASPCPMWYAARTRRTVYGLCTRHHHETDDLD